MVICLNLSTPQVRALGPGVMNIYWGMRREAIERHNREVAARLEADTEFLR